ncbi:MAG: hypothetical protein U0M66_02200 [Bacilli bacterium]|nr:hypothetical protein [Bacilli bacterium]
MFKGSKFNILMLISFSILLVIVIYSFFSYDNNNKKIIKRNNEVTEMCKSNEDSDPEKLRFCKEVLESEPYKTDFLTTFSNVILVGSSNNFSISRLAVIIILFIVTPTIYHVCRYLKSGVIVNAVTRESFSKNKQRLFKYAYMPSLILPIIILIAFLISYLYSADLSVKNALETGTIPWGASTVNNPFWFVILYVLNILIHSVLFINISLCVARKYHNFFVSLILTYLVFLATEVLLEVGFGGILFTSILKMGDKMLMFNIMNMFSFNDTGGMLYSVIVPFTLMIITSGLVLLLYRNKERLIIDCSVEEQKEAV